MFRAPAHIDDDLSNFSTHEESNLRKLIEYGADAEVKPIGHWINSKGYAAGALGPETDSPKIDLNPETVPGNHSGTMRENILLSRPLAVYLNMRDAAAARASKNAEKHVHVKEGIGLVKRGSVTRLGYTGDVEDAEMDPPKSDPYPDVALADASGTASENALLSQPFPGKTNMPDAATHLHAKESIESFKRGIDFVLGCAGHTQEQDVPGVDMPKGDPDPDVAPGDAFGTTDESVMLDRPLSVFLPCHVHRANLPDAATTCSPVQAKQAEVHVHIKEGLECIKRGLDAEARGAAHAQNVNVDLARRIYCPVEDVDMHPSPPALPSPTGIASEVATAASAVTANPESNSIQCHVLPGDLVIIDEPLEHRGSPGVVTKTFESHCVVTVLDASKRFGIAECWPYFNSLMVESTCLRIGSRVVLDGLQGTKTRRMNGYIGTIIRHPREGHPSFIKKPSRPDNPILTVCVRFDEPKNGGHESMLIEPRFLVSYDSFVQRATDKLVIEQNCFSKLEVPP